jgi:hypothetical protein
MIRAQARMRWTAANQRLGAGMAALIGSAFAAWQFLPVPWAVGLGLLSTLMAAGLTLHVLRALVSPQALPPRLRGWLGSGVPTAIQGERQGDRK